MRCALGPHVENPVAAVAHELDADLRALNPADDPHCPMVETASEATIKQSIAAIESAVE